MLPYAELYTIEVLTFFGRLYEVDQMRRTDRLARSVAEAGARQACQRTVEGNMQRLLIALALISPQPMARLDEPFDGLDLHQTQAMMGILRDLRDQSRTLCCVSPTERPNELRSTALAVGRSPGRDGHACRAAAQAGLGSGSLEEIFLALTDAGAGQAQLAQECVEHGNPAKANQHDAEAVLTGRAQQLQNVTFELGGAAAATRRDGRGGAAVWARGRPLAAQAPVRHVPGGLARRPAAAAGRGGPRDVSAGVQSRPRRARAVAAEILNLLAQKRHSAIIGRLDLAHQLREVRLETCQARLDSAYRRSDSMARCSACHRCSLTQVSVSR